MSRGQLWRVACACVLSVRSRKRVDARQMQKAGNRTPGAEHVGRRPIPQGGGGVKQPLLRRLLHDYTTEKQSLIPLAMLCRMWYSFFADFCIRFCAAIIRYSTSTFRFFPPLLAAKGGLSHQSTHTCTISD